MPAPQVLVVQAHSDWSAVLGATHCVTPAGAGNADAVLLNSERTWLGVMLGCTERINAAAPETMGAEKLVPSVALKASV
jgi:hypothetical protein